MSNPTDTPSNGTPPAPEMPTPPKVPVPTGRDAIRSQLVDACMKQQLVAIESVHGGQRTADRGVPESVSGSHVVLARGARSRALTFAEIVRVVVVDSSRPKKERER